MATYAPYILAPPLTTCTTAYLTFGQGSAPFTINIISTGDANGTTLEQLPLQHSPGVVKWRVDFNAGANITFAVTDGKGATAYSQYRVVQTNLTTGQTTCSKTDYNAHSSHAGAIAGGIIGGLALLAIVLSLLFWRRRQLKRDSPFFSSGRKHGEDDDDMRLSSGGAGVVRAGTFNLGQVRFTEASLDHLRAIDRPPGYHEAEDAPPSATAATSEGSSFATTTGAGGPAASMTSEEAARVRTPPPVPQQRRSRVREEQERRDRELAERLAREEEMDGVDEEEASTVLARTTA